jgi:hypothetical protein
MTPLGMDAHMPRSTWSTDVTGSDSRCAIRCHVVKLTASEPDSFSASQPPYSGVLFGDPRPCGAYGLTLCKGHRGDVAVRRMPGTDTGVGMTRHIPGSPTEATASH